MENHEPSFITFGEILDRIRRRKWILVICLTFSVTLALYYNYVATPIYRVSAIVSFERFSKDNMLDMDFANARFEENFISNRIKEVKTRTFAENVFHALPDSFRQLFRLPDPEQNLLQTLKSSFSRRMPDTNAADLSFDRYVITKIQEDISVARTDATPNILTISFVSENPDLATKVTNTAIDALKKSNLSYRRQESANLKQFIDEQITVVEDKLAQAEEALSDFKSSGNITSLEDESREILRRITQAEVLYNQIQTDKKAKAKKLAVIQNKIDEQRKDIGNNLSEDSSPMIIKLKELLVNLEVESANLQVQGYAEDHPRRQELVDEIKRTKQNLIELTMGVIEDRNLNSMVDPLSRLKDYLEESVAIDIEIQALVAQERQLQRTLRSYNARLKTLSTKDATLFGLLRDREVNNKLYVRLLEEREQARLKEAAEIATMHVIDRAQTPLAPYKPRKKLNIVIALLVGTVTGLLVIFIRESFKDVPLAQEDIEALLNLPVLASIPKVNRKWTVSLNGVSAANGYFDPVYRDAYAYLWHSVRTLNKKKIKSVMVTSATPGEGKSTVSANIAITAAKLGKKTLLIDGDLRRPTLAKVLNASDELGISDYIAGRKELQDLPLEGLKFLSAGTLSGEPGLFWAMPRLQETLKELMADFDFVVIDSPPVLGIPDAVSIAAYVDAIIMCVEAEQVEKKHLLRTCKILAQTSSSAVGVVWNKVDTTNIYGRYKYQKYYQNKD